MICLELTPEQNEWFLNEKKLFSEFLLSRRADVIPVLIKNGNYVLQQEILNDENFKELHEYLIEGGHLEKVTIREIDKDEFITDDNG